MTPLQTSLERKKKKDCSPRFSSFPPGPEPDEHPFFYDVPHANPPMNIKFRNYQLQPDRDETQVEETLRDAVADCSGPGRRAMLLPDRENYWESGDVTLMVLPGENCESAIAGYAPLPSPSLI